MPQPSDTNPAPEDEPIIELIDDLEDDEPDGSLPEEDDDNRYQDSDDALPDDLEEAVLDKDPSKEGSRFDEV